MQTDSEMKDVDHRLEDVIVNFSLQQMDKAQEGIRELLARVERSGYQRKWYERGWYQPTPEKIIEILRQTYAGILDLIQANELDKAREELEHLRVTLKRNWEIMKDLKEGRR